MSQFFQAVTCIFSPKFYQMKVTIEMYKYPPFEVNVPTTGTIRNLQIKILTHLRIPTTEHNLNQIILFQGKTKYRPFYTLSSLHISEKSKVFCWIKAKSLEKIEPTIFDDEFEESNDNEQNSNDICGITFNSNDNNMQNSSPNRLYQTSTYIYNDSYSDIEDVPSNLSDFCFYYAQKDQFGSSSNINPQSQTLPLYNDLILTKEDNQRKGHMRQIKRYESLIKYSDEIDEKQRNYQITRATSSVAINRNSNLCSSSFTSGENLALSRDGPSCDSLPCCFPTYMTNSFSTTGISFLTNSRNEMGSNMLTPNSSISNKLTSSGNNNNKDKNNGDSNLDGAAIDNANDNTNDNNKNDDNENNSSENNTENNNEIFGLDFSIKTEDHKSNF